MSDIENRLPPEEHARIFREVILPEIELEAYSSQANPKAVILAGQPGAGKGSLKKTTEIEFRGDIVPIDTDEMREFHPDVERFRRDNPYAWAQDTHPDARLWSHELRNAAIECRKHILIDTTPERRHGSRCDHQGTANQGL